MKGGYLLKKILKNSALFGFFVKKSGGLSNFTLGSQNVGFDSKGARDKKIKGVGILWVGKKFYK